MKDDDVHDKQAELISNYQKEIRQLTKKVQDLQMNKTIIDDNGIEKLSKPVRIVIKLQKIHLCSFLFWFAEANDLRRKLASFEEEQAEKTRVFNEEV